MKCSIDIFWNWYTIIQHHPTLRKRSLISHLLNRISLTLKFEQDIKLYIMHLWYDSLHSHIQLQHNQAPKWGNNREMYMMISKVNNRKRKSHHKLFAQLSRKCHRGIKMNSFHGVYSQGPLRDYTVIIYTTYIRSWNLQ